MNSETIDRRILRIRDFATRDRPVRWWFPKSLAAKLRPRLDIPCLDLKGGECYAVIGKSGAGKTVFNSFLAGWPAFQCGRGTQVREATWWNGDSEIRLSAGELKSGLARLFAWRRIARHGGLFYLPQLLPDGRGYAMPVRVYLKHVLSALRQQVRIRHVDGDDFDDIDDPDVRAALSKTVDKLSGGERRRVELWARLRVLNDFPENRPGLLILDEPTTGLDVVQERNYLQRLRKSLNGRSNVAAVVTTHALSLLSSKGPENAVFDGVIVVWKKIFPSSRWNIPRFECDVSPVFNPRPKPVPATGRPRTWAEILDLFQPSGIPNWNAELEERYPRRSTGDHFTKIQP